jgi:hypothetical protein
LREYLDWCPFDYFTNRFTPLEGFQVPAATETMEFVALDGGGTRVNYRIRAKDRSELGMQQFEAATGVMRQGFPLMGPALRKAIEEDADTLGLAETGGQPADE